MGTLTAICTRHPDLVSDSRRTCFPVAICGTDSSKTLLRQAASRQVKQVLSTDVGHIYNFRTAVSNARGSFSSSLKMAALLSAPFLFSGLSAPSIAEAFEISSSSSTKLVEMLPLADLDPAVASVLMSILGPVFSSLNFLFIIRIVMSWYPQLPVDKFPYVIAFAPTEPVLEPTRKLIPPVGGVDVSPVIWVAIMSFLNEILLGQQGLLVLLSQQQG